MFAFFASAATLIGTIIGVGIFGLPFAIEKAGFGAGIALLALLGGVVTLLHLLHAEVVLRTREPHRLAGYGTKYLGAWAGKILWATDIFSVGGALLAYLTVGGMFLAELFRTGEYSAPIWSVIFWILFSTFIFAGLRAVSEAELIMSFLLLASLGALVLWSAPRIDVQNLFGFSPSRVLAPYGVILFSFWGLNAIGEVRDVLSRRERLIPQVIIAGTLVPFFAYAAFVAAMVGVAGPAIPENALGGMREILGEAPVFIGLVFGILAVATSFITLGKFLGDELRFETSLPRIPAYLIALGAPLVAFFAGFREFLPTIGFLGAVGIGVSGVFVVLIYLKARRFGDRVPEFALRVPTMLLGGVALLLFFGAVSEIIKHF